MKIKSVQISNILSFQHFENVEEAPEIKFDDNFNILIGPNGSGKSTALEAINFALSQVLFRTTNYQPLLHNSPDRINTVQLIEGWRTQEFRLQKNYNYQGENQKIRIIVELDAIDKRNISILSSHQESLLPILRTYSPQPTDIYFPDNFQTLFSVDIVFNSSTFQWTEPNLTIEGIKYLMFYNFYNDLIRLNNLLFPDNIIEFLYSSVVKISGYRNYDEFADNVTLNKPISAVLDGLLRQRQNLSINSNSKEEPIIFKVIRYKLGEVHKNLLQKKYSSDEATEMANNDKLIIEINESLKPVNIKIGLKLSDIDTWTYSFELTDTLRNTPITNINYLSAGQKSILHLVMEVFGTGDINGGVIIIDEPELHLHYQSQSAYLAVIRKINEIQKCQYILVTHSESMIDSSTINSVKRFTLDKGYTVVKSPVLPVDYKKLLKMLDVTRSTHAFFARKILLVEGITDFYFFKSILLKMFPHSETSVVVMEMGGKGNYDLWKNLFQSFGLEVHFIGDFDNLFSLKIGGSTMIPKADQDLAEKDVKSVQISNLSIKARNGLKSKIKAVVREDTQAWLNPKAEILEPLMSSIYNILKVENSSKVAHIKGRNSTIEEMINSRYSDKIYLLKEGDLETYTGVKKNIADIITFCNSSLDSWLLINSRRAKEIKKIMNLIMTEDSDTAE